MDSRRHAGIVGGDQANHAAVEPQVTLSASLAPLRYPAFRHLVTAKTASTVGSWMQLVAAGWLTLKLTGSAASVGLITSLRAVRAW